MNNRIRLASRNAQTGSKKNDVSFTHCINVKGGRDYKMKLICKK